MWTERIVFPNTGLKKLKKDSTAVISHQPLMKKKKNHKGPGEEGKLYKSFYMRLLRTGLGVRWGWGGVCGCRQRLKHNQPSPHLLMQSWPWEPPLIKVIQHLTGHCTHLMGRVRPSFLIYAHSIGHTDPASVDYELSMVAVFRAT